MNFKDLVPELSTEHNIHNLLLRARFRWGRNGADHPDALFFNCSDYPREPAGYMPWCLMRCAEFSDLTHIPLRKVSCTAGEWELIKDLWPLLQNMSPEADLIIR